MSRRSTPTPSGETYEYDVDDGKPPDVPTTYTPADLTLAREVECVQCGERRKRGEYGKWWPTGAWSCALCYDADFG